MQCGYDDVLENPAYDVTFVFAFSDSQSNGILHTAIMRWISLRLASDVAFGR